MCHFHWALKLGLGVKDLSLKSSLTSSNCGAWVGLSALVFLSVETGTKRLPSRSIVRIRANS